MTLNRVGKGFFKLLIIMSIGFLICGILVVNSTIPEVAKDYSGFHTIITKEPLNIVVKAGEYKIKFSAEGFVNFKKGLKFLFSS